MSRRCPQVVLQSGGSSSHNAYAESRLQTLKVAEVYFIEVAERPPDFSEQIYTPPCLQSLFAILMGCDNAQVKRKKYASNISCEKFAEIEPMLRSVRRNM